MNEKPIAAKEILELLRADIHNQISEVRLQVSEIRTKMQTQISGVRSDIQALEARLRNVEEGVAGQNKSLPIKTG